MNQHFKNTLSLWHEFVATQNAEILDGILDENVKFHSPFLWKPKELSLRGVDLIKINEEGRIIDFEVMIRPANALQTLGAEMGKRLAVSGEQ
jgi:hypothetical protein